MGIKGLTNYNAAYSFKAAKDNKSSPPEKTAGNIKYDKNPISKSGERANALKATAGAGLLFGLRALWWLCEEGFEFDMLVDKGIELAKKKKKAPSMGAKLGAVAAVIVCFVGALASIYTLYNTPKAMYKAKVNTFKKSKEMDVYIRGNEVEKELYNQMNDKAKEASPEEKEKLSRQYAKLKAAKNQVPDFVKLK